MTSETIMKIEPAVDYSGMTAGIILHEMNKREGRVDVFVEDFEEGVLYRVHNQDSSHWQEGDRVWFVPEPKLKYRQRWTKYVAMRL